VQEQSADKENMGESCMPSFRQMIGTKRTIESEEIVHKTKRPLQDQPQNKNQSTEIQTLQASIKAQIAARSTMEVHLKYLEDHHRNLQQNDLKNVELERQLAVSLDSMVQLRAEMEVLKEECSQRARALAESEAIRRTIHENYMALRGNMRVYCRLKPGGDGNFAIESLQQLVVNGTKKTSVDGSCETRKSFSFNFDRVLSPAIDQHATFTEVEGLVQSALDGNNVCIFAYGQTGSGKTHTMMGDDKNEGIIPRSLRMIFNNCSSQANQLMNLEYSLSISFLEIYNEKLKDLLSTKSSNLNIKVNGEGAYVNGLCIKPVKNMEDIDSMLTQALRARTSAKTSRNENSSRSHALLTLHIQKKCGEDIKSNVIHLVDLAGSERRQDGESQKVYKEQCAINSSLSALKSTLHAIGSNSKHVPYRDSKLTFLMSKALMTERAKTLMICTIALQDENISESLSTLRFAEILVS